MNKKCVECGKEYVVENSNAFHHFRFCADSCQDAYEQRIKPLQGGIYLCSTSFPVEVRLELSKEYKTVREGSKWIRNDSESKGLSAAHLKSLSGAVNGLEWLEVTEELLGQYFEKVN